MTEKLNIILYKEGCLEKRGISKFLWKKYWCTLTGNIFRCYQMKETIPNSLEKVSVNMNEVQTVKKSTNIDHGYPFEFTTKLKTIIWSAESEKLREEWIKDLQQAILYKIIDNRIPNSRSSEDSQNLTLYASVSSYDLEGNQGTCNPYEVVSLDKFLDTKDYVDSLPCYKDSDDDDDDDDDDGQVIFRNNPLYQQTYKYSNIYEDITLHSEENKESIVVSECFASKGSSLTEEEESESHDEDGTEVCHSFIFESQFENSLILNEMSPDVDIFTPPHPYFTTDMCPKLEELKEFLNELENKLLIKTDENQLTTYDDLNDSCINETAILEIQKFLAAIELENKL